MISKPGLPGLSGQDELPQVVNSLGVASCPAEGRDDRLQARATRNVGGEVPLSLAKGTTMSRMQNIRLKCRRRRGYTRRRGNQRQGPLGTLKQFMLPSVTVERAEGDKLLYRPCQATECRRQCPARCALWLTTWSLA